MPKTNLGKRMTIAKPSLTIETPSAFTSPDLTDLIVNRLTDDLLSEIDLNTLPRKVLNSLMSKVKNRFIAFLTSESNTFTPLSEIDAQNMIAGGQEIELTQ